MGNLWGSSDNRNNVPVQWTEEHAKALVAAITEAVTKDRASDLMEQYKQFVLASSDLAEARREIGRKDQEIFGLQARIATLNSLINSLSNGGQPVQYPIQTTQAIPSFQDRFAVPVPPPVSDGHAPWSQPTPLPPPGTDGGL